jgi:hypothetical protein
MSEIYDITDRNPDFTEQTLKSQGSGKTSAGNKLNYWALIKEQQMLICDEREMPSAKAFDHAGGLVKKPKDPKDRTKGTYHFGLVQRKGQWVEIDNSNSDSVTKDEYEEGNKRFYEIRGLAVDRAIQQLTERYGHPVLGIMATYWCNFYIPRAGSSTPKNTFELPKQNAAIAAYFEEHKAASNIEGAARLYSDLKYINDKADPEKNQVLTIPEELPSWLREQFVLEAERSGNLYDSLVNRLEIEKNRDPSNEELLDLATERLKVHEKQVAESGSLTDKTMMLLHGLNRDGLDKVDPDLFNQLQLDLGLHVAKNRYFNPSANLQTRMEEVNIDDKNDRSPEAMHLRMPEQETAHGYQVGLVPRLGKYQQAIERRRIYPHLVRQVRGAIIDLLRQRGQEFEPDNPAAKPMNYHDWIFAQGPEHLMADVDRIYMKLREQYPETWGRNAQMAWIVNYIVNALVKTRHGRSDLMGLARANQPTADPQTTFAPVGDNDELFVGD